MPALCSGERYHLYFPRLFTIQSSLIDNPEQKQIVPLSVRSAKMLETQTDLSTNPSLPDHPLVLADLKCFDRNTGLNQTHLNVHRIYQNKYKKVNKWAEAL